MLRCKKCNKIISIDQIKEHDLKNELVSSTEKSYNAHLCEDCYEKEC